MNPLRERTPGLIKIQPHSIQIKLVFFLIIQFFFVDKINYSVMEHSYAIILIIVRDWDLVSIVFDINH